MLRKIMKIVGWTAGGALGLAALLYLAGLAINRSDRPPSPATVRLASLYRGRPAVADADNAYVYLMGFHAPRERDPFEAGLSRVTWIRSAGDAPLDPAGDPLPNAFDNAPPRVDRLSAGCGDNAPDCAELLDVSAAAFDEWAAANGWWLERYRAMIERSAWQEIVPVGSPAVVATSFGITDAQTALLFQAGVLAERGDAAQVGSLLAGDARFWRMVLQSSDSVITKMIAVGALRRNFEWGNLALRKLPPPSAAAAVPGEWRTPFTAPELSLRRVIAGEWHYVSGMFGRMPASSGAFGRFFQSQDTLNRIAGYYSSVADTLDAPLEGYAAVTTRAGQTLEELREEGLPPRSLYNPLGKLLLAQGGLADFSRYAARVADLEGMRRGALAAVTLRTEGVQLSSIQAALRTGAARNPYDGEPLLWDESRAAIVFRGLERGTRGDHRFYF